MLRVDAAGDESGTGKKLRTPYVGNDKQPPSPTSEKSSSEGSPEVEKVPEPVQEQDEEDNILELDVIWEARANENANPRQKGRWTQQKVRSNKGEAKQTGESSGPFAIFGQEDGSGDGKEDDKSSTQIDRAQSLRGSSVVVRNIPDVHRIPPSRRTETLRNRLHYELDRHWARIKGDDDDEEEHMTPPPAQGHFAQLYEQIQREEAAANARDMSEQRPTTGPAPETLYEPSPEPEQHTYTSGGRKKDHAEKRRVTYPWGHDQAYQLRAGSYKPVEGSSPRKPGPREIGRNDGFAMPNYGVDLNDERARATWRFKFLEPRWHIKSSVAKAPRKDGPREIGRNEDYEKPDYGVTLNEDQSSAPWNAGFKFLEPRWHVKSSMGKSPKKAGPREIGRSIGYEMPDYGIDLSPGRIERGQSWNFQFLEPRYQNKTNGGSSPRKAGPRETGWSNYKTADYGVNIRPYQPQQSWNFKFLEPRYHVKSAVDRPGSGAKSPKKAGPREIGRSIGYVPADYGIRLNEDQAAQAWNDHLKFLQPRYDTRGQSSSQQKAPKKLGPTSIGYMRDYRPADYGISDDHGPRGQSFLEPRVWSPRSQFAPQGSRAPSKAGPREIGRIKYHAYEHAFDDATGGNFLQDRLTPSIRPTVEQKSHVKKAGPREIGRIPYKAAEYQFEGPDGGSFLLERLPSSPRARYGNPNAKAEKKPGPREIGRIQYDALEHDYEGPQGGDFLMERMSSSPRRITQAEKTALKKPGPREIGRNTKYDAMEHDYEGAHGDSFLVEKLDSKSVVSHLPKQKSAKKLGPRDIGRNNDYDPMGENHADAEADFLEDRLTRFV